MPGRAAISESPMQNAATMILTPGSKRPAQSIYESREGSRTYSIPAAQPVEPEDAYLTGVSRSLQRRLLGLNVQAIRKPSKPHSEESPLGQFAKSTSGSDKAEKKAGAA
jgi:hypothetical protein